MGVYLRLRLKKKKKKKEKKKKIQSKNAPLKLLKHGPLDNYEHPEHPFQFIGTFFLFVFADQ